ncbi:MAG: hypothetical protein V1689_07380, partial [Pseudomonadota bacterium]
MAKNNNRGTYYAVSFDRFYSLTSNPLSFELLQKSQTTSVFQLESNGMKRWLRTLKPSKVEDIIAMVALYRPGPM